MLDLKKLPQIGQTIYWITGYPPELKEGVITGVVVEGDRIEINIDNKKFYSRGYDFYTFNRNNFWFSKKKAENVLQNELIQVNKREIKSDTENKIFDDLKNTIKEVSGLYINKEVLVKKCNHKGEVYWDKTIIKGLWPHTKTKSYSFSDNGNVYLLTKENKTWKFFTDKLKLEMEKESLEKQLKAIEEKLKQNKGTV